MTQPRPVMVLHIGSHKTGSTSIQHFLATHPTELAAAGFAYPVAGRYGEQHAGLPAALLPDHPILPPEARNADPAEILAAIAAEVPPHRHALLSSEVFWELLLFQPDGFRALHEQIAAHWRPVLVHFAREPHAKSWSAVKHMGREGLAFDPVEVYRGDLRLMEQAEATLRSDYPQATRIEYDGVDSVRQLLDFLGSPAVVGLTGLTAPQQEALRAMTARRRPEPPRRRPNRDFANPYSAAVSLVVSEALAGSGAPGRATPPRLPRLYAALFAVPLVNWGAAGLPDDRALGERVRRAAQEEVPLFAESEVRAVRQRLGQPSVRALARLTRRSEELGIALAALDARLDG